MSGKPEPTPTTVPRLIRILDVLQVVRGDEPPLPIRLVRLRPYSAADGEVALVDQAKKEVQLLPSLAVLDPESRQLAEAELAIRYPRPRIQHIRRTSLVDGLRYLTVETAEGSRILVLKDPATQMIPTGDGGLVLRDQSGNRFLIPDLTALDAPSRARLAQTQ